MMLTVLQEKLAEAHGLAIAAAMVVDKVEERTLDLELRRRLWAMQEDAAEVRARCLAVEEGLGEELAEELLAHANTTREHAADLAVAWFKAGTSPLRAWSFLAMGEAGEVATWAALQALAARANTDGVAELAAWGLPLQRRHLELALDGAALLAREADPNAPRWG
jgi:hypothetical protein